MVVVVVAVSSQSQGRWSPSEAAVKKLGSETRQQTVLLSSYYELLAKSLPLPGPVFLSIKWGQVGMLTRWSLWVHLRFDFLGLNNAYF